MAIDVDERDLVIELLTCLKKFLKFKELESMLGISVPTLWRYIHGDIKPSIDRARQMLTKFLDESIVNIIREKALKVVDGDVVNVYSVAYDIDILTYASIDASLWAQNSGFNTVVTVETDGIPLATLISKRLGAKLVVIKRKKEIGYDRFIEASYITISPPEVVSLYLPEGVIEYGDKVLVVDDLIRSGRTTAAAFNLIKKAGGRTAGFYALIGIGSSWKSVVERYVGSNYRVLFHIKREESI